MKKLTKNKQKNFVAFCLCTILILSITMPVSASAYQESSDYASYDMTVGGIETFHFTDKNGEEYIITITELCSDDSRIADGKYQIEFKKPLCWTAGFTISVSSNHITSAYNEYSTPFIGSISDTTLRVDHSTQASYHFKYHLLSTMSTGIRCVLDGDNIQVYSL